MAWRDVKFEPGPVSVVTIDRPERRNAVDFVTMDELDESLGLLEADRGLRVVILTGGGETFISGGDLKSFQDLKTAEDGERMARRMESLLRRLTLLPVPVIAAINGPAIGGGAEVALACDLRVMEEDAYIAFRQVSMGLSTAWGAGPRLLRSVGFSRALHYLLTSEHIGPDEALRMGLIQRVARPGQAMSAALELAEVIATQPPLAVRSIKRILLEMLELPYTAAVDIEARVFGKLWASEDHHEAVRAFFEKRRAAFQGR